MRVYKEKQFLVFKYTDGTDRVVKYDFSTKQAIGIKGKPVKDLRSQLSGMTIGELIECFDDKNYAAFLRFIYDRNNLISNIGTILSKVPEYAEFEQIFSSGIGDKIDIYFSKRINDIPKSLIKIAKTRYIKITNRLCNYWNEAPDAHYIGYQIEFTSLDDKDLNDIFATDKYKGYMADHPYESYYNQLINRYGYNPKSLLLYIDSLKTFEAIDDMRFLIRELVDYAEMMSEISNKYDRYPRHFLTTHKIACRNYYRLKQNFNEKQFKQRINKEYECTFGDYMFIYPDSTSEIKDEAVSQNNCVASYIDRVIDGECHIMFLRKKHDPKKSLVTIEIRGNKIVQAKRHFNYPVTAEDQVAIDKWNKKFATQKHIALSA